MSRRLIAVSLVFAFAGFAPGAALAAAPGDDGKVTSKFYDFGEQLVNGTTSGPALELYSGHRAADFGRLLSLKKDLLPRIYATRAERTFK